MNWLDPIITLTVVANMLPILPVVLNVVSAAPRAQRRSIAVKALIAGNVVALLFAFGGGALLRAMHCQLDDVRIAGGLILMVFATFDLLFSREQRKEPLSELADEEDRPSDSQVGLVPLGVPLMVGPATLAVVLVLAETYGVLVTLIALVLNGAANVLLLLGGEQILDRFGHGTVRAIGKVFGLLLAALAVSMVRTGIVNVWNAG